ncbi:beta-hexosaminidase subunit alpha-like [Dendronephthya gigantea]|uniref:beta-hexosaminidase subunit alpha-like n=1 Tax=Dendronephthya gigantea TaxID=151771 RepID=UPI00106D346F|nr:beta-hexosaminidase subunit alpha-like [Dendronephthya gigantea]
MAEIMSYSILLCVFILGCNAAEIPQQCSPVGPSTPHGNSGGRQNVHLGPDGYVSGSIWPKPQQHTLGEQTFTLSPNQFEFTSSGEGSDVLAAALKRYQGLTFPDKIQSNAMRYRRGLSALTSLDVSVKEKYAPMTFESDESYTLTVSAPASSLTANTIWGALRGLETFSQLVYQDENGNFLAKEGKITDFPRFHHRGFLIDTSRHFIHVNVIFSHIDALAYAKYNVLHWHIVDDDSFPFVSETFPSLSNVGAFNNVTHIYSVDDVSKVIEYGRLRGIRVIPEFDTPGHTQSWVSIKNFLTPCYSGGKPTGKFGPVNPTLNTTYTFLKSFFGEVAKRFPDDYIHLGGDEVSFSCWESNPDVLAWMDKMRFGKNFSLLEQYYEQKLIDIVGGLEKKYIIWQEVIDNAVTVSPDTVVNVWKDGWEDEMAKVTAKNLNVILSSPWYLNYISYGDDWPKYYQVEPTAFNGTSAQKKLVLGGTTCMWGEWVDGTNLLSRSWPRSLSISERLWSSINTTDVSDAEKRLREHRCRYLMRGIPAQNGIESKYCRYEWPGPV